MLKILKFLFKIADEFFQNSSSLIEVLTAFFKIYLKIAIHHGDYILFGLIVLAVFWYIYLQKE